jgi:hypothetical protein
MSRGVGRTAKGMGGRGKKTERRGWGGADREESRGVAGTEFKRHVRELDVEVETSKQRLLHYGCMGMKPHGE